jgi:hypothetical protein
MIGDSYTVHLGGVEYEASLTNDPDVVNLWWDGDGQAPDGFVRFAPGEFRRSMPISGLDDFVGVEWFCEYRGEPFKVLEESEGGFSVSYLGGNVDKARQLGLDVEDQLVAFGFIPRGEAENIREVRTRLWPKE